MIVPISSAPKIESSVVTLPMYRDHIKYDSLRFFGFNPPLDLYRPNGCVDRIWTKDERDLILAKLCEAQEMMEDHTNLKFGKQWVEDEIVGGAYPTVFVKHRPVYQAGHPRLSVVGSSVTVDDVTADPFVWTIADTTVTMEQIKAGQIKVKYAGEDIELHPSSVTVSGGTLTITIPKWRAVAWEQADNPRDGLAYTAEDVWQRDIDVFLEEVDDQVAAVTFYCDSCSCAQNCDEATATGCAKIKMGMMGKLDIWRTDTLNLCCPPYRAKVGYQTGIPVTKRMEAAIIRLAHSLMEAPPCGECRHTHNLWATDRELLKDFQGSMNPFGEYTRGAWTALKVCEQLIKTYHIPAGGVLGRG